MKNLMDLLKQAQEMQQKLKEAQDELMQTEVIGTAADGAVTVTCDGQGKFKSIKLTAEALDPETPENVDPEIVEMVEDIVTTALYDANLKAMKLTEQKMKSVTGGFKIPGFLK